MFGKVIKEPRLTCYIGDHAYKYSGRLLQPLPWSEAPVLVQNMRRIVQESLGVQLNSVLLNRYRHGQDGQGYHADDEPVYGDSPTIVSCSFGETRDFVVKPKEGGKKKDCCPLAKDLGSKVPLKIPLTDSSCLVMGGTMQKFWLHSIPKRAKSNNERINLTFRNIVKPLKNT